MVAPGHIGGNVVVDLRGLVILALLALHAVFWPLHRLHP